MINAHNRNRPCVGYWQVLDGDGCDYGDDAKTRVCDWEGITLLIADSEESARIVVHEHNLLMDHPRHRQLMEKKSAKLNLE